MFRKWRINRINVKLAGLEARLKAIEETCRKLKEFPVSYIHDALKITATIGELTEKRRQLSEKIKP